MENSIDRRLARLQGLSGLERLGFKRPPKAPPKPPERWPPKGRIYPTRIYHHYPWHALQPEDRFVYFGTLRSARSLASLWSKRRKCCIRAYVRIGKDGIPRVIVWRWY